MPYRTIIEPFKIHSTQAIDFPDAEQREAALARVGYNVFGLHADEVIIDLLTDSGTGAMSARQWAGMMVGDESYAGSRSFYRLQEGVADLTGLADKLRQMGGRHLVVGHSNTTPDAVKALGGEPGNDSLGQEELDDLPARAVAASDHDRLEGDPRHEVAPPGGPPPRRVSQTSPSGKRLMKNPPVA